MARSQTSARLIASMATWFVVGLLASMAVAWVSACGMGQPTISRAEAATNSRDGSPAMLPAGWSSRHLVEHSTSKRAIFVDTYQFVLYRPEAVFPEARLEFATINLYGVPFRAFGGFEISSNDFRKSRLEAYSVGKVPFLDKRVALPLRPAWPGLVANSIVFGGLAWFICGGWCVVRGWRRRKRGACARCAYDLRGLAQGARCPECGLTRE